MGGGGGVGGLLNGATVTAEAKELLEEDADDYTWAAAAIGAQNAASYQLATDESGDGDRRLQRQRPVPDASPSSRSTWRTERSTTSSPAAPGGGMGGSSSGTSSQITSWVEANFKKVTVGRPTFYDLTQKASG